MIREVLTIGYIHTVKRVALWTNALEVKNRVERLGCYYMEWKIREYSSRNQEKVSVSWVLLFGMLICCKCFNITVVLCMMSRAKGRCLGLLES